MPDTNQSFDLPRWQTHNDPLSSSAQAAHAAQASYHYSGPPPPPPQSLSAASPQRIQPLHQTPTGPSRQPRISQLLEQDQQLGINTSPYLSSGHNQLARSASLSSAASGNNISSRGRRHHQPEDLEGAFSVDNQGIPGSRQPPQLAQTTYYPTNPGYQQQSLTGPASAVNPTASPTDSYSDMYYNGSATQPAKRPQGSLEPSSSARAGRSPLRGPNPPNSVSMMDSYSQQSQYSPTTTSYAYGPPPDQRTHQATYHSHSRNHSQVKQESMTPPIASPYTPQTTTMTSAGPYSSAFPMDTSSPHPPSQIQTHLTAHVPVRQNSASNPPTPLSYLHAQNPGSQYYSQEQAMLVDPPPKRRASGFRRVRTAHDLQPRLDIPPTGRRMGGDGTYLSVRQFPVYYSHN